MSGLLTLGAVLLVCAAMLGFPVYHWVRDKRRRGERSGVFGFLGVVMVGLLASAAVCSLLYGK